MERKPLKLQATSGQQPRLMYPFVSPHLSANSLPKGEKFIKINGKPCIFVFIIINLSQKGRDDVGYKLQQVRESAGMTQDQLAAKSGVSRNWIWKIEAGKTDNVSIKVLLALANALDVKIDDIFFLDE